MKRIIKNDDSDIITENLNYTTRTQRPRIIEILLDEQNYFCAYTEERFAPTIAFEIEHFNPDHDSAEYNTYNNWFAACRSWNLIKKDEQWHNLQPILHPTAKDLEARIIYDDGYYIHKPDDTPAKNLKVFLDLNNLALVTERRNYIGQLRTIQDAGIPLTAYLANHPQFIRFRRAIETEFLIELQ